MSYSRRLSRAYELAEANRRFRQAWEEGWRNVKPKLMQLQSEGWMIKDIRSKRRVEELKRRLQDGSEVETVTVAEWMGEPIEVLLYKPKPKPETSVQEEPAPEEREAAETEPAEADTMERLKRAFPSQFNSPLVEHDHGLVMDKDRVMAYVKPDATPASEEGRRLLERADKASGEPPDTVLTVGIVDYRRKSEPKGYSWKEDDWNYYIDWKTVRKIVQVLGRGKPVEVRRKPNTPVVFTNPETRERILVAPYVET
ncbi:MAG: hypothetical protein QXD04_05235 [Candidatus Bathyarchaeia archaeon]